MKPRTYKVIAREIGALVEKKNAAYGSSFANAPRMMQVLYPHGVAAAQYDDALLVVRILDKLQRIATDRDALGESPWADIAGYGILGEAMRREKSKQVNEEAGSDAAQVPAVGVRQTRQTAQSQVLQREVPPPAGGEREARETQYLRVESVPDVQAQPHWSAAWQARQDDRGVAQPGVPADEKQEAQEVRPAARGRWHETTGILRQWPLRTASDCYQMLAARQEAVRD